MWLKRSSYENLVRADANAAFLRAEVEYWRAKFEEERERADRIGDRAFEIDGRAPVSVAGARESRASADEMKAAVEARLVEMRGTWDDDDGSDFIDENGMIEVEVEQK